MLIPSKKKHDKELREAFAARHMGPLLAPTGGYGKAPRKSPTLVAPYEVEEELEEVAERIASRVGGNPDEQVWEEDVQVWKELYLRSSLD